MFNLLSYHPFIIEPSYHNYLWQIIKSRYVLIKSFHINILSLLSPPIILFSVCLKKVLNFTKKIISPKAYSNLCIKFCSLLFSIVRFSNVSSKINSPFNSTSFFNPQYSKTSCHVVTPIIFAKVCVFGV